MSVNLEHAIKTALEYEGRVHRTYLEASRVATHAVAQRVFSTLCEEEKTHLTYLHDRLTEWRQSGKITMAELGTAIPSRAAIAEGVARLKQKVSGTPPVGHDAEIEALKQALAAEVETANFYKEMVRTLEAQGRRLFERFVEIEEGHQAIVQAELDSVTGLGFWFDTPEFQLEGE
jgi:bacterioferritin (cytochrome b1)